MKLSQNGRIVHSSSWITRFPQASDDLSKDTNQTYLPIPITYTSLAMYTDDTDMDVFVNGGIPKNGWFAMEIPIKMDV